MAIKKILKRRITHTDDEVLMRHKLWFDYDSKCDGISATANMDGFTTLNAIKMHFGWGTEMIRKASDACNEKDEIAILDYLTPKLFLVPRTTIDNGDRSDFYIRDLLAAVDAVGVKRLQFTHYSFIDHLGFKNELRVVLKTIFARKVNTKLDQLVLDVDDRVARKMVDFLDDLELR